MQIQTTKKASLPINEYFLKMKTILDNLKAAGNPVLDEHLTLYLLASLGAEYEHVVVNLTSRSKRLSLQEVYPLLLNHESRLKQHNSIEPQPVFLTHIIQSNIQKKNMNGSDKIQ